MNDVISMNDLIRAWELATKENEENRRKVIHNYGCKTSELQPYENRAFLEMVATTFAMLRMVDEKRKIAP